MPEKCSDNCPLASRVEALERANERHSDTHQEIFGRLGALETLSAVQENKLDTIMIKLDMITEKLGALEAKPGKRWESIVEKAIWAVAAAMIAFLLARIGL